MFILLKQVQPHVRSHLVISCYIWRMDHCRSPPRCDISGFSGQWERMQNYWVWTEKKDLPTIMNLPKTRRVGGSASCTCFLLVPDANLTGVKLWLILQPRKSTTRAARPLSVIHQFMTFCLIVLDFVCKELKQLLKFYSIAEASVSWFCLRLFPTPSPALTHRGAGVPSWLTLTGARFPLRLQLRAISLFIYM